MADNRPQIRTTVPGAGAVYFLGLIGALVYYLQLAHGFWPIILAILKAFVWPAFLVYDVLRVVSR